MTRANYNATAGVTIQAPSRANEITKEYYNHLVGEINRGTVKKAVCRVENLKFNTISYHLISI
jgi:hypothetical protein